MNRVSKTTQIVVLPKLYDFILWYTPRINQYPKKYKYTLECSANTINEIGKIVGGWEKYSKQKQNG